MPDTSAPSDSSSGADDITNMVSFALAQQGKGYSEGAGRCGPDVYDCSGLVYRSCVQAGIRPPGGSTTCTDTFSQWAERSSSSYTLIPPNGSLASGDLIYFDNGQGGAQPGHVGICVDGSNMMNALNTKYGCLVCPISWGGSIMGSIRLKGSTGGIIPTLGSLVKDGLHDVGLGGVADAVTGGVQALETLDKMANFLMNPKNLDRIGKGLLGVAVGFVALYVIREGFSPPSAPNVPDGLKPQAVPKKKTADNLKKLEDIHGKPTPKPVSPDVPMGDA